MNEEVITPTFFGHEFKKKCERILSSRKRSHSKPIHFLENHDLKEIEKDSKKALLQGRCVVRIDKYCVVVADTLTDWKMYKSHEKNRIETLKRNENLKNDPLGCAIDELATKRAVTTQDIRKTLGKYTCFSPEYLYFAIEYLEDDGIEIIKNT